MSSYEVLSTHEVRAVFQGVSRRPCRFMTSLCPDRCNHAQDVARFGVEEYISYTKSGEYGDEKQESIYFTMPKSDQSADENHSSEWQPVEFAAKVKTLSPGDKVILRYEHRYMKDAGGSQWPVRPFTKLQVV